MDTGTMNETLQTAIDTAISLISNWGLSVIGAILLLIVGRWIAGVVRSSVRKGLVRSKVDETLIPFFSSMVYYALMAVVVIAVMNLFGIETTSIVAVMAAAGLAVGLALQGTLSNFASGVMLLIFRPFKAGNWVEVAGVAGSVQSIGVFSTTLNTGDNIQITIPNGAIYGSVIKNYSANENRRIDLVMGVSYGDDIGKAVEAIERVLTAEERVLRDPAPTVAVSQLGGSSVDLVVRPWCSGDVYWPTRFALTRALKEGLEAAGCSIPFPQSDVHIIEVPGSKS